MQQYIRCLKSNGQIASGEFESEPTNLPHTLVFWVKVAATNPDGSFIFPHSYGKDDAISFVLTTPLTAAEMAAANLIKDETAGSWQHSLTQTEAEQKNLQAKLQTIDNETYSLIKDWCRSQPEGCEEAFMSIGISDKNNARFLAYLNQKVTIKAEQEQKKSALTA